MADRELCKNACSMSHSMPVIKKKKDPVVFGVMHNLTFSWLKKLLSLCWSAGQREF